MKTTINLTSKTGKQYDITLSFNKRDVTYNASGIGSLSSADMMANFALGYTKQAQAQLRKENKGRTIEIKKSVSFGGSGVSWNAKLDDKKISENVAEIFFRGTPANGIYEITEAKILNTKRIASDKADKEWACNAERNQEF